MRCTMKGQQTVSFGVVLRLKYEKHQIPSDAYRGNEPKSREVFRTLLLRHIVSFSVLGLSR